MRPLMLFHVVLPRERFPACRTMNILLTRVFFPMARRVAGGGEGVVAGEAGRVRAGVFLFEARRFDGGGDGGGGWVGA